MDAETITLPGSFLTANADGYDTDKEQGLPRQLTSRTNIVAHLKEDIDPAWATAPLAAYSFMSGLMCVGYFTLAFPSLDWR